MARKYVKHTGPIFATTVGGTVKKAIADAVRAVALVGKAEVKGSLHEGYGLKSGAMKKDIRAAKSKKWVLTSVVFARDGRKAAWLSGTSKLNARSRFKGLEPHPFSAAVPATQGAAEAKTQQIIQALVETLGGA